MSGPLGPDILFSTPLLKRVNVFRPLFYAIALISVAQFLAEKKKNNNNNKQKKTNKQTNKQKTKTKTKKK